MMFQGWSLTTPVQARVCLSETNNGRFLMAAVVTTFKRYLVLVCVQLPLGDGDQGCYEEVPQPHEP